MQNPCAYLIALCIFFHRIAQNLFRMLRNAKKEQLKLESKFVRHVDRRMLDSSAFILGKHYKRTTRFREPIVNMKLLRDGLFCIYGKIKHMDVDSQVSGTVGAAIAGLEEAARVGFTSGHSRSYDLESGLLDSGTPTLRILPYFTETTF